MIYDCNSPSIEVWPSVVGRLKLCHPHVDMVAKGRKVCRPVTSTPKAKLPLPTCSGVVLELALRYGLQDSTILRRSILLDAQTPSARCSSHRRRFLIIELGRGEGEGRE